MPRLLLLLSLLLGSHPCVGPQVTPQVGLLLSLKAGRPMVFVAGPGFWEVGVSPSRGREDKG